VWGRRASCLTLVPLSGSHPPRLTPHIRARAPELRKGVYTQKGMARRL